MASSAHVQAQHDNLLSSMFQMDILGDYYKVLESLEIGSNPSFLAILIPLYGNQFQEQLTKVSKLLGETVVDFSEVDFILHQLKEDSTHMGAKRVMLACNKLSAACKENDKEECVAALNDIRHEFDDLYKRFLTILELKERIKALDAGEIVGLSKL